METTPATRKRHRSDSKIKLRHFWRVIAIGFLSVAPTANLSSQSSFIYINGGNYVSCFSVNSTGALSEIPGSPFRTGETGSAGSGIVLSPRGEFLYVNSGTMINAYSINANTGVITPIPGSPFTTAGPVGNLFLAMTPNGRFLYALNNATAKIDIFSIAADGKLIQLSATPFAARFAVGIKVSPNSNYLFLSEQISSFISVYAIDSNGNLTNVPGSPYHLPAGCDNGSFEINCSGDLLFAATTCGEIFVLKIGSNGTLTQVAGSPFNSPQFVLNHILLNSSGNLLFVSDIRAGRISVLGVSPGGAVSSVPISSVNIIDPNDEDIRPTALALNREETRLFVNTGSSTTLIFNVSSDGMLIPVQSGSPFAGGYAANMICYPGKTCVPMFDFCIQDESSGNLLNINLGTGNYQFTNCSGVTLSGKGSLIRIGGTITLQHYASDRRVVGRFETSVNRGTASIQLLSTGTIFTITDRNTSNNTCACDAH